MAKVNIWFPESIRDDAFANRRVTLNVIKAKDSAESIIEAVARARQHVSDIGKAIASSEDDSVQTVTQNIETNAGSGGGNTEYSIVLPLPNELTDSQSHDWNTNKGIFGTVIGGIENQSMSQLVGGTIGSIAERAGGTVPVVGAGITAGGGMEAQQALGAMSDAAGLRKPLADPGYFQNYTGSQPRNFEMTFDFVPKNAGEALDMIEIILKLKKYSSPDMMAGGVSMLAPHYFDIKISNPFISSLINMNGVVLRNMVVNYGADGAMQQFPDGTPKYIQLALSFAERKMSTSAMYSKPDYSQIP